MRESIALVICEFPRIISEWNQLVSSGYATYEFIPKLSNTLFSVSDRFSLFSLSNELKVNHKKANIVKSIKFI